MNVSVKQQVALKRRRLSSKQPKLVLGQQGENKAVSYLLSQDYLIKARNVLYTSGEIDIVAFDPFSQEIVFCEVKTRSSSQSGHPTQAIDYKKRRALLQSAIQYLHQQPTRHDFRFDVISITPRGITHFTNITI